MKAHEFAFECLTGKESICQSRRQGFDPWVGKILRRSKWHSHGQRSLVGCSPRECRVRYDWVTEHKHTWICRSKEALLQVELGHGIFSGELCSRCLLPSSLEQLASLDCPYGNVWRARDQSEACRHFQASASGTSANILLAEWIQLEVTSSGNWCNHLNLGKTPWLNCFVTFKLSLPALKDHWKNQNKWTALVCSENYKELWLCDLLLFLLLHTYLYVINLLWFFWPNLVKRDSLQTSNFFTFNHQIFFHSSEI